MSSARLSLASVLGVAALAGSAIGGDLNPPVGPVAPSMTTLQHIEPRICINDMPGGPDAVHRITQPGQYFLRAPITVPNAKVGIGIDTPTAGRVVVHMNGFGITGEPGSLDGIRCLSLQPLGGDVVFHGDDSVISGMGGDCIHIEGSRGVVVIGFTL